VRLILAFAFFSALMADAMAIDLSVPDSTGNPYEKSDEKRPVTIEDAIEMIAAERQVRAGTLDVELAVRAGQFERAAQRDDV